MRLAEINISVDGKTIKPYREIRINQKSNWHDTFEVRFPLSVIESDEKATSIDKAKSYIGKPIKISIKSKLEKKPDNFFNGVITEVDLTRSKGSTPDVILSGFSPSIYLDDQVFCRSFSEKSLSDIVNEVIKPYPKNIISPTVSPKFKGKIPYFVQYKETNYHFLRRLANLYGEWFYWNGSKLNFGKTTGDSEELTFGDDLLYFDLELKLVPNKFKVLSYDYVSNKVHESAAPSSIAGLDGNGDFANKESDKFFSQENTFWAREYYKEKNALDEYVKLRKAANGGNLVSFSGTADNPKMEIGDEITIKGLRNEDYGKYFLTAITHIVDSVGNYENNFQAVPSNIESPPPCPYVSNPVCESQMAVVKENFDKDEKLGRIRVQFPWQKDPEKTPWVRMINYHAGKDRGFYWIPEKGDEVLVGFENDNPNNPYIIGSYYHGKAKPKSDWPNSDNLNKAFKTISGNEIFITDEKGKEEIKIFNSKEQNIISLCLEGDGKITIKSKGDIEILAGKSIKIEAQEEINMKSGKATHVENMEMTVKAQKSIETKSMTNKVEAQNSIEMKAQQVKVEGTTVAVKASSKMDVEGTMTTVKGNATLDLKGGGMANLQAGLVKIN